MEKILLIPLIITSLFLASCQSRSKKVEEMRKQTHIESPYEITQIGSGPVDANESSSAPSAVSTPVPPPAKKAQVNQTSSAKTKPAPPTSKTPPAAQTQKPKASSPAIPKDSAPPAAPVGASSVPAPSKAVFPFSVGEQVTYSITFFAVEAGRMTMEVRPFKQIQGERTFHFYVTAVSSSVFSLFYSVKDYAESFWSERQKRPYLMKIYGEESKYVREIQASFDWAKKSARYQAKILKVGKDLKHEDMSWKLNSNDAQDVISALYKLRTYDLKVGETYKMHVAEKGKDIVVSAEVVRKETLKTRVGRFETLVVKPTFTVDGNWKQVGDVLIWLTDDENKIPIGFEAKVKIGTIKGRLHSLKRS